MRKDSIVATALLCVTLMLAASASAADQQKKVVPVDRLGAATPWLAELGDEATRVVHASTIPMLAGLPLKTGFYSVDDEVVEHGYFYYYYVRGKRNDYMVESTMNLFKLCYELEMLEELLKTEPGVEFLKGIGRGIEGMFAGVGNLIIKPGQTLRSVGVGIGRMFSRKTEVELDEKGEDRSLLGSGPAGNERRRLAYQFGLDVYTENPEVRQALTGLSQAGAFGGFATWAIPGSTLGMFNRRPEDEPVEEMIRDYGPDGIRNEAGKALAPVFNMARDDKSKPLARFILNPNYTARQLAFASKYLYEMRNVQNIGIALHYLAAVDTPETADLMFTTFQMYYLVHTYAQPLVRFDSIKEVGVAQGANGVYYFIFPGDILSGWSLAPEEVNEIIEIANSHHASGLRVLALGAVDPGFAAQLKARGMAVSENLIRDSRFFGKE